MSKAPTALKRLLVGRPLSRGELEHTLLPKVIALPVFSSDALSSVAYATQEMILVLGLAGVAAIQNVVPISFAVAALLAIVVLSYRQTVRAYPSGGGAYIVAHENLGRYPGLLAAAALLIDYVLTVSVSIVAGVDAVLSALPGLRSFAVILGVLFVSLVTMANLRGVRESGTFFAIPTYGFVLCMFALLATGFIKCLGGCPQAPSAGLQTEGVEILGPFLIFKAFAAGTTALTGVEAISNGVPAFRYPQSKNAATTMTIMAGISISLFLGMGLLAASTNVVYEHGAELTVVAEVASAVFGQGPMFYLIQVMTAAILFLAANTAFAGFPLLASILATDRFMPHQFMSRGDRLVFSNGVVILAVLASLLIIVFRADLNQLIQLYLVGVFVSFTLSQLGMVVRWRRTREAGWRRSSAINGFGAVLTFTVLVVVIQSKFLEGAYVVVAAIPVFVYGMHSISRHYEDLAAQVAHPARVPTDRRPGNQHMVIMVTAVDAAAARGVGYVRSIRPAEVTAVAFDEECKEAWGRMAPEIPLTIALGPGSRKTLLKSHLRAARRDLGANDFLTIVIPETIESSGLTELLRKPWLHFLKASLIKEPGVQVLDIPLMQNRSVPVPGTDEAHEPSRNYALVLVSAVNNATLQAIEYAETLRPTDLTALSFGLDPNASEKLGDQWLSTAIPHPLEIDDSPFRDLGKSLVDYLDAYHADGTNRVVTVILPEFVVSKRRHQLLHGQTALALKRRLLFEPGVVTVSVPYHLEDS